MSVFSKVKRAARGEVRPTTVALEVLRRGRVSLTTWRELSLLTRTANRPARFANRFAQMESADLLAHFRTRTQPKFFPGFTPATGALLNQLFPQESSRLIDTANRIKDKHCWQLLGYGEKCFGAEVDWRRDPLSGFEHPLVYHRNVQVVRNDGSDARVLWELNRLGHLITLGCAYAVTKDETYSSEFFRQIKSWSGQNPFGQGPNWNCAMEVALRAMNLLAAFELFRLSPELTKDSLSTVLALFDQSGTYIQQNLEFSYVATSNHYLSDVVGLLWLGIMLPELRKATEWREFGLREMFREMDKQILADGADYESSTGYHRFVLELLLYSFMLCRSNGVEIAERYWLKLKTMLQYLRGYIRPDGCAPLIGDSDSGQVLPIRHRRADDHAFLLALGAVVFNESRFKEKGVKAPEELLWLFGENGVTTHNALSADDEDLTSISFPAAGVHVLRQNDLYLALNTTGSGINGRGSHGHNDALSVEISACGRAFVVDPGTYKYTGDLASRHKFRSTAYHSTVQVDDAEQNTIDISAPFIIGDEAKPRLLLWETRAEADIATAEHYGYERLPNPLTHRRMVVLNKTPRCWLIEDQFIASGDNTLSTRFHFAAGLDVNGFEDHVIAHDPTLGAKLVIYSVTLKSRPALELQFTSIDYGERRESISACWSVAGKPAKLSWLIVPVGSDEVVRERLEVCKSSAICDTGGHAFS